MFDSFPLHKLHIFCSEVFVWKESKEQLVGAKKKKKIYEYIKCVNGENLVPPELRGNW